MRCIFLCLLCVYPSVAILQNNVHSLVIAAQRYHRNIWYTMFGPYYLQVAYDILLHNAVVIYSSLYSTRIVLIYRCILWFNHWLLRQKLTFIKYFSYGFCHFVKMPRLHCDRILWTYFRISLMFLSMLADNCLPW